MRRSQIDAGSQPLRNLVTNPGNRTVGSPQTLRTNLAIDPRATAYIGTTGAGWRNTRWFGPTSGAGTHSLVTGAVDGPLPELTTYIRKTWSAAPTSNGNTGFENVASSTNPGFAVTAGTTYAISSYLRSSASGKTNALIYISWYDNTNALLSTSSGTQISLTAGQWSRVSTVVAAPTGAVKCVIVSDLNGGTIWAPGDTLDGTGLLIESAFSIGTFFSGLTTAGGDFTYAWAGTANSSVSYQRVVVPTGLVKSIQTGTFQGYQSTQLGLPSCRFVSPAGTASSGWRVAGINTLAFAYTQIKVGRTYTIGFKYKATGFVAGNTMQIMMATGGATNNVFTFAPSQTLTGTGILEFRHTFVALRDADTTHQVYISLPPLPHATTDGVLDILSWFIVEGTYTGDYIDGTLPFSKWDGTANASTSVGYPPQLFDIAGKPEMDISAAGNYALPGGYTDTEPRTLYTVYGNTLDIQDAGNSPITMYGIDALTDTVPNTTITLRQQLSSTVNSNNLIARKTGGGGALSAGSTVATNVAAYGLNVAGNMFIRLNNGTMATDGTVMVVPHQRFVAYTPSTAGYHIRSLLYRGFHDAATQAAISRYLGNKYGAAVA